MEIYASQTESTKDINNFRNLCFTAFAFVCFTTCVFIDTRQNIPRSSNATFIPRKSRELFSAQKVRLSNHIHKQKSVIARFFSMCGYFFSCKSCNSRNNLKLHGLVIHIFSHRNESGLIKPHIPHASEFSHHF